MLFDTHTHPYITFKKSPEYNLEHFFWADKNNKCISIWCDIETSKNSIAFAQKYPQLKATIGFHPCDLPYTSLNSLLQGEIRLQIDQLKKIYHEDKKHIVAIWEIGLDYYHLESISQKTGLRVEDIKQMQNLYFRAQIWLARELWLPFVIHSRESNEEVLEILTQQQGKNYVFHCYSGDWELAQKILQQNSQAMFGLWGVLTYKKSQQLREVAKNLPLESILIETDAPFLTPEPLRGREENEPIFVSHILKKLQELRDESPEEIESTLYENAKKFFRI